MSKYTPECYRIPNRVIKLEEEDFTDRSGNKMKLTVAHYKDKQGKNKTQVLRVIHL